MYAICLYSPGDGERDGREGPVGMGLNRFGQRPVSISEAKRLVKQGIISINGVKAYERFAEVKVGDLIRIGGKHPKVIRIVEPEGEE